MGSRWLEWLAVVSITAGCGGTTTLGNDGGADAASDVTQPVTDAGSDSSGRPVTAVATGGFYTCVIADTAVWCWGAAPFDVVAFDNAIHTAPFQRTDVPPSTALCASATGDEDHVCAVTTNGDVYCWGGDFDGQLGNDTTSNQGMAPAKVQGVSNATSVACGDEHTCALTKSGNVFCWGDDQHGQLGDGEADGGPPPPHDGGTPFSWETGLPVAVTGLSNVTAIAAGWEYTCAVASDEVWCWGADLVVGNPDRYIPTRQPSLDGATAITVSDDATACAVANGTAYCWGYGAGGELGNGAAGGNPTDTPVAVVGVSNAISVSIGSVTGCAATNVGDVWCWGDNTTGQLGNGTVGGSQATPARVNVANASAVSTGMQQTCAITSSGLMCWGSVGLGDGGILPTPTLVTW